MTVVGIVAALVGILLLFATLSAVLHLIGWILIAGGIVIALVGLSRWAGARRIP